MTKKHHTKEFKRELVKVFRAQGGSQVAFAKAHGVNDKTFHRWLQEDFDTRPSGEQSSLVRIAELEAEVRELRWERDVLKKATAFFAKESR